MDTTVNEAERDTIIRDLIDWIVDGGRTSANAKEIVRTICERLVLAGVPVQRFALFINTLHPNLQGRRFLWVQDEGVDIAEAPMGTFSKEAYTANPLPHVIERKIAIRRHLENPDCPADYDILKELKDQGITDYVAHPLIFTTGETNVCTWSSARVGGFSEDDLLAFEQLRKPLARLTEIYMLRLNASNLLSTYVGRRTGRQILDGLVHRGDGEEIAAVVLFVDLKDFTKLSNQTKGLELVELLNDTFDLLIPPVEIRGGEILKFVGDGFLAIFPYQKEGEIAAIGQTAIDAVLEGCAAVAENRTKRIPEFRAALHFGTFHYGNIGGANRLDFTAIGPPVNYAARLLSAAATLGCDRVMSADLAKLVRTGCVAAGEAELKGLDGKHVIWKF